MKSRVCAFNGILVLALLAVVAGCGTTEERKRRNELSNFRVHVESDSQDQATAISVMRVNPIRINIEREPVLDENHVVAAMVVDDPGGFAVEVKLTRQGHWLLENASVVHGGKHLAIFSQFGQNRWLAAPLIRGHYSNGVLKFTPDATRDEAERFVRGLNNLVRKQERKENWPFPPLDR
jgi:hypothetical protein